MRARARYVTYVKKTGPGIRRSRRPSSLRHRSPRFLGGEFKHSVMCSFEPQPRKSEHFVYFSMGLAAGAAGADVGVEAATTEQGAAVAARWPLPLVGLRIESACPSNIHCRDESTCRTPHQQIKAALVCCKKYSCCRGVVEQGRAETRFQTRCAIGRFRASTYHNLTPLTSVVMGESSKVNLN